MINPLHLLRPQRRLLALERELIRLRRELAGLQQENDSMRAGMRRCTTCLYRLDFKQRQGMPPPDNTH
jgi:hypothetical protein